MNAELSVEFAGPYVSLQDDGRPGHMRFGVPRSGPMDRFAFLVLRSAFAAGVDFTAVEVSTAGLQLKCLRGPVTAGVVGGKFHVDVDGQELAPWSLFEFEEGATLSIRGGGDGSWAYLGFAGQLAAPRWLASHSTHLYSGLCGQPLQNGDTMQIADAQVIDTLHRELSIPPFSGFCGSARVVLGPQDAYFSRESITTLFHSEFSITPNYNRMGIALKGEPLVIERSLSMPSEALVRGSVQVTGSGESTILMSDHQTTGGYPKIATVISTDIDQLAQSRPGDALRFVSVSAQEAVDIRRKSAILIASYLDRLN